MKMLAWRTSDRASSVGGGMKMAVQRVFCVFCVSPFSYAWCVAYWRATCRYMLLRAPPAAACAAACAATCVCVCGLDAYIFFLYLIFFERNINMMNDTNDMNDEHNELNPLNQR